MIKISYNKVFVDGLFNGLTVPVFVTYPDDIPYRTVSRTLADLRDGRVRKEITGNRYVVTEARIEKVQPKAARHA